MSNKPMHRFWQIHLSTAMVFMLALGLILYLNVAPSVKPIDRAANIDPRLIMTDEHYGWPFRMAYIRRYHGPADFTIDTRTQVIRFHVVDQEVRHDIKDKDPVPSTHLSVFSVINTLIWNKKKAFWNAIACLGSLMFLVVVLELSTKRREVRT